MKRKQIIILVLWICSFLSVKAQETAINVHGGLYHFGWNPVKQLEKRRASSPAIISGVNIEIKIWEKSNLSLYGLLGYRDILGFSFPQYILDEETETINSYSEITNSHYGSVGLMVFYKFKENIEFGTKFDFLVFLENNFDIYQQNRVSANLELVYRKKINERLRWGLSTPLRILPYSSYTSSVTVTTPGSSEPFEESKQRIGAAGMSIFFTYAL